VAEIAEPEDKHDGKKEVFAEFDNVEYGQPYPACSSRCRRWH
jgi:hypothetical protein